MKALILCAGAGLRLKSSKPKCLINIKNKLLIDHTLSQLIKSGINKKNIYFATGYKSHLIEKHTKKKFKYIRNNNFRKTNMVYSLFNALKYIKNEDILIVYSDIWIHHFDIKKLILQKKNIVTLIDKNWKNLWKKTGKIKFDLETLKIKKNKILELGKKTNNIKDIDGRYIGLTKFSKKILTYLKKICAHKKNRTLIKTIDMTNFLMFLIKNKVNIYSLSAKKKWYEFDNKKDLKIFLSSNINV